MLFSLAAVTIVVFHVFSCIHCHLGSCFMLHSATGWSGHCYELLYYLRDILYPRNGCSSELSPPFETYDKSHLRKMSPTAIEANCPGKRRPCSLSDERFFYIQIGYSFHLDSCFIKVINQFLPVDLDEIRIIGCSKPYIHPDLSIRIRFSRKHGSHFSICCVSVPEGYLFTLCNKTMVFQRQNLYV